MARDYTESAEKKFAEEALGRKAKPRVLWCYKCSIRFFNNFVKRESTIKQKTCKNCGKIFKTNSNRNLCFDCQK